MKKRLLALLLTAVMLAATAGCAGGDAGANTETEGNQPGGTGTESETYDGALEGVTLQCTASSFQPYRYADTDGSYIGYDFDVIDAMAEILGFTYNFTEIEFAGTITSIATGASDFAGTLTKTEERLQTLDFTEPYYKPHTGFAVVRGSDIKTYEDLKGSTIIAPLGTTHQTIAESIPDTKVNTMDSLVPGIADVKAGRADAIMGDSVQVLVYAQENDMDFYILDEQYTDDYLSNYNFAFAKGAEYVKYFDYAIEKLKADGTLAQLQEKWLGKENVTVW